MPPPPGGVGFKINATDPCPGFFFPPPPPPPAGKPVLPLVSNKRACFFFPRAGLFFFGPPPPPQPVQVEGHTAKLIPLGSARGPLPTGKFGFPLLAFVRNSQDQAIF